MATTIGIDTILNDVAKLDTKDLETFHQRVGGVLSLRKSKPVKEKEKDLVKKILRVAIPTSGKKSRPLTQLRARPPEFFILEKHLERPFYME